MARDFSITRRQAGPGEALDPTASLEFWPAKGSDELFEALKKAYPHLPNQAARMRQAVIDFLLDEQREENWLQEQAQSVTNPPSQSQYLPSPELTFVSSTGSIPSPTTSSHTPQPASESSKSSASTPQSSKLPALKDCMHEWSLPSKNQPKLHHRRAMTSKEKEAYKMKRISGACADCKRKRRKCSHDTSGSQQTSPSSSGKYRVSKKTVAAVPGIVSKAPVAAQLSTPVSTVAVSSDSSQNSESANHSIDPTASSNLSFDALQDIPWNDFVLFDPPQPEVELDMSSHWFGNNSWSNNVPGDFVDLPAFPTSTNHIPSLETSLDFSSASSQPTPDFSLAHDAASFSQAVNHNPFVSTHQLPDLSYTSAPTHTLVGPTMDFAMPASQGAPLGNHDVIPVVGLDGRPLYYAVSDDSAKSPVKSSSSSPSSVGLDAQNGVAPPEEAARSPHTLWLYKDHTNRSGGFVDSRPDRVTSGGQALEQSPAFVDLESFGSIGFNAAAPDQLLLNIGTGLLLPAQTGHEHRTLHDQVTPVRVIEASRRRAPARATNSAQAAVSLAGAAAATAIPGAMDLRPVALGLQRHVDLIPSGPGTQATGHARAQHLVSSPDGLRSAGGNVASATPSLTPSGSSSDTIHWLLRQRPASATKILWYCCQCVAAGPANSAFKSSNLKRHEHNGLSTPHPGGLIHSLLALKVFLALAAVVKLFSTVMRYALGFPEPQFDSTPALNADNLANAGGASLGKPGFVDIDSAEQDHPPCHEKFGQQVAVRPSFDVSMSPGDIVSLLTLLLLAVVAPRGSVLIKVLLVVSMRSTGPGSGSGKGPHGGSFLGRAFSCA